VAVEIRMPKLGMTMEEGKVLAWTKKEKERVDKGEVLLTVESDKVTFEVESPGAGILAILVEQGEGIPVTMLLGLLAESEEEYLTIRNNVPAAGTAAPRPPAPRMAGGRTEKDVRSPISPGAVRATPAARELARQRGVCLAGVAGTGPQGRITREDILNFIEISASSGAATAASAVPPDTAAPERKRLLNEESMSSMRVAITRRMMQSLQTSAQMTVHTEWDVTALMGLRAEINQSEERNGYRATIPGLLVALVAGLLKEMPVFNATVDGDRIKYWKDVNVGVAVALPDGLVVPVIHGADRKTVSEIHTTLGDLVDRAHHKKLLAEDMADGTFTISNFGSHGGDWITVILNPPEVAILGIGEIGRKPVVRDDRIVIRQVMPASLTVDHRLIDGAVAGTFCRRMKELVENPSLAWAEGAHP
jgi:pyruvate dehydrogenase E2 component (dihydrolipoamide acetyltransferase)